MSNYAFSDPCKEEKFIVYAKNAIKEDIGKVFYCPEKGCPAHLYICSVDGSRTAYFGATKKEFPHKMGCFYGRSCANFDDEKFDEDKFNFNNAMDALFCETADQQSVIILPNNTMPNSSINGTESKRPPRTIRQIYFMCKSRDANDTYGGTEIGNMILDGRSEDWYSNGCLGRRIIEAVTASKIYDNDKQEIYLKAPKESKKYTFCLHFADAKTYRTIRTEIYNNKDRDIIVAGNWKAGVNNCFMTEIIGRKQIYVVRDR